MQTTHLINTTEDLDGLRRIRFAIYAPKHEFEFISSRSKQKSKQTLGTNPIDIHGDVRQIKTRCKYKRRFNKSIKLMI